jgi:fucose permease
MPSGQAAAAVSGIVAGMFVGRFIGSRITLRVPPVPFFYVALGVSAIGFAVFWSATAGWLATAGLVILGLGNAMHFPLGISLALRTAPGLEDLASARASYGIAVCFGVAPLALGAIADGIGPHPAFLLVPVLLVVAALLVLTLRTVGAPQVRDGDTEFAQQVPEQREGQPDDRTRIAIDALDERAAQPIDRERAGHP